ncbi:MAG: hypothetical protein IPK26_25065 [Planctomycetes bacterium]|nr:hypothetical protein [Planctomycetota bacterium]
MQPTRALAFALLVAPATTQAWTVVDQSPGSLQPIVFDPVRGRPVGFTALPATAWSFDGAVWRRHSPDGVSGPQVAFPAQVIQFAVHDPTRQQTVVVGETGSRNGLTTWISSGAGFELLTAALLPRRSGMAAAFDPVGARVLTFGGVDPLMQQPSDAMESWTGSRWLSVPAGLRPPARSDASIATDPVRRRVVLFGGVGPTSWFDDTWEWDGQQWAQASVAVRPTTRLAAMVWDPRTQQVVVLGGVGVQYTPLADCWGWNGVQWAPRTALPVAGFAQGYDDGSALFAVLPGPSGLRVHRSTATGWTQVASELRPIGRYGASLAWDATRGEVLMAGGGTGSDTWAWNGAWIRRATTGPGSRVGSAMAPIGNQLLLFGGSQASWGLIADTWLWNGQAWTQQFPVPQPWPRAGHAMVGTGSQVLLFGGVDSFGMLGDTWTFDGVAWTELQPAAAPPPRSDHGMAWDTVRQRAVLYGGADRVAALQDTWEWDGTTWLPRSPATQPQPGGFALAWSPTDDRVLMVQPDAVWSWDGVDWRATLGAVSNAWSLRTAWHEGRQRLLAYGVDDTTSVWGATPASAAASGTSCGSRPDIRLFGRAAIGSAPDVHVEAAPGVVALIVYGLAPVSITWAPGCFQEVGAIASTAGVLDARGVLAVPFPIPANPAFRGTAVFIQGATIDGGPVFGGSLTGALQLVVGD